MQLNGRIDLFNKHSPELGRRRFRDRNRIVSNGRFRQHQQITRIKIQVSPFILPLKCWSFWQKGKKALLNFAPMLLLTRCKAVLTEGR